MGISVSCEWCTLVVHVNLNLNPNVQIQATGRALRLTQTQTVFVYILYWCLPLGNHNVGEDRILTFQAAKVYVIMLVGSCQSSNPVLGKLPLGWKRHSQNLGTASRNT